MLRYLNKQTTDYGPEISANYIFLLYVFFSLQGCKRL